MRSHTVLKNLDTGQNRFELCHQAFKAIRKLHNPGNRIQDTANDALQRLAAAEGETTPADAASASAAVVELIPEQVPIESQAQARSGLAMPGETPTTCGN